MASITEIAWFFKHKPKTLDEYVFESETQKERVLQWIENKKIESNLLLYGPAGTGKTALAELLINSILSSKADLKKIKSRSVKEIDELEAWLQKRPVTSKSKIIYFEEFDKISDVAMDELKDGLLEKYQQYNTFIATTNYIRKIPHPIQTRFTIQFNLTCSNIDGVVTRLEQILKIENVQYDPVELQNYVQSNIKIGLRDLINNLQSAVQNNTIDFKKIGIKRSVEEDEIIINTIQILKSLLEIQDINLRKIILLNPLQSDIQQQYSKILEIININNELQYEMILEQLNEQINYIPIKLIISKYIDQFPYKRFPHITYLAFLAECMECILHVGL